MDQIVGLITVAIQSVVGYTPNLASEGQFIMSCKNEIDIIQGEDREFLIKIRNSTTGDPVDFSDCDDFLATFLGLSEAVELTLEGDGLMGTLRCTLTEEQTEDLQAGLLLGIQVSYTDADAATRICKLPGVLNVLEQES